MVPAKLQVGTPGKLLNQLLATKPERFRREQEEKEKTEREKAPAQAQCVIPLHYFKRCREPRGDTYSTHGSEAKDKEMAGATRIVTPDKVRELQIVLYRKGKQTDE